MNTGIRVGTIISGRHTATGQVFLGRVTRLPKNSNFKLEFEYLEDFGRSERSKRGCLGRTWKTNVWRVNTPPPSINTMRFKNKKRRVGRPKGTKNKKSRKKKVVKTVKTVVTTTTTTIINQ